MANVDELILAAGDSSSSSYKRTRALEELLSEIDSDPRVMQTVTQLAEDADVAFRRDCLRCLAQSGEARFFPVLARHIHDEDDSVQREAFSGLEGCADPEIAAAIKELLPDLQYGARYAAERAVAEIERNIAAGLPATPPAAEAASLSGLDDGDVDQADGSLDDLQEDTSLRSAGRPAPAEPPAPDDSAAEVDTARRDLKVMALLPQEEPPPPRPKPKPQPRRVPRPKPRPQSAKAEPEPQKGKGPLLGCFIGFVVVALLAAAGAAGVFFMMWSRSEPPSDQPDMIAQPPPPTPRPQPQPQPPPQPPPPGEWQDSRNVPEVQLVVAYGSEKRRWLQWAHEEYRKTRQGQRVKIDLVARGSRESAEQIVAGELKAHVWIPAGTLFQDYFIQRWRRRHGARSPVQSSQPLMHSPLVFIFWKERHLELRKTYPDITFANLTRAAQAGNGWEDLAGKPDWGFFQFGHTNPEKSNSGFAALVLMAYEYHNKQKDLTVDDVRDAGCRKHLIAAELLVAGLKSSTGGMMRDMVLKGPSSYDVLFAYENLAIDYLKNAQTRWGTLYVVYPQCNIWNNHPFHILQTPWTTAGQQQGARQFMLFLLSRRVQQKAVEFGFRPVHKNVDIHAADSPFKRYRGLGLQADVGAHCQSPDAEVIQALLEIWARDVRPKR